MLRAAEMQKKEPGAERQTDVGSVAVERMEAKRTRQMTGHGQFHREKVWEEVNNVKKKMCERQFWGIVLLQDQNTNREPRSD